MTASAKRISQQSIRLVSIIGLVLGLGATSSMASDFTVRTDDDLQSRTPRMPQNSPPPPPPPSMEEGFLINGGAPSTRYDLLDLQFVSLRRNMMKITANGNCAGGVWEPWLHAKQIPVPAQNQLITLSAQYKDWDGGVSPCYPRSIIHDAMGPDIDFTKYPEAEIEEGTAPQLIFDVTDALSPIELVTCALNGVERACAAGTNVIDIAALQVGDYEFAVTAQDQLGNSSAASVSWKVVTSTRQLSQNIRVDNLKKVDVLIVIDNSPSMKYEQKSMAKRTSTLLSVLKGMDYQIAVTTTDPREVALGGGRFLTIEGMTKQYLLTSKMNQTLAQQRLSATLQRKEQGDGKEQPIFVTRRVIDRYVANEKNARAFFRPGAQFAVLAISDEDESGTTEMNDPQKLVDAVQTTFLEQKRFGFHSIVTKSGDVACRDGEGGRFAVRLEAMSQLTGGEIGSVCAKNYARQVTGIAQGIRNLLKTLSLKCRPLADRPIVIKRNNVIVTTAYKIEGVNLKFASELLPGQYNVEYQCLKN